jgi:prepilin-type processing-associated H-X9-DG protein
LLVVIGIIAVLISLLMPILSGVRKESRKTVCKAHLQQIGQAVRMYTDQFKDRYPRSPALPSVNPNNYPPVQDMLAPYLTNVMEIFRCPADETVYPTEKISYFYYSELGEKSLHDSFLWKVYKDVTRIPVLWDADHYHGGGVPFNWLMVDGHVDNYLQQATTN